MPGADKQSNRIPRLTGNSTEAVFAFLVATVEHQKKKGVFPLPIYTPFVELETQQAIISQFETRELTCNVYLHGSGLDWHLSTKVADQKGADSATPKHGTFEVVDRGMKYDDLVMCWSLLATIVGIVYGAFHGDIIHGFMVGFAVGLIPALPLFLFAPFVLVWEKFFEKK